MIASGSLALIVAARLGWSSAYLCMAGLMALGVATILMIPEPEAARAAPQSMKEAVWGPLSEFLSRPMAGALLGLIVLYKLGDAFAGALTTSFLLRGMEFSPEDIGVVRAFGIGKAVQVKQQVAHVKLGFGVGERSGFYGANVHLERVARRYFHHRPRRASANVFAHFIL